MKKILFFIFFIVLSISGIAEEKKDMSQLVIAQEGEARSLDPHFVNDGFSLRISKILFSRLVENDENMKIIPGLAKTWKNINGTTWEFQLKEGVKFHSGKELTAEDVKFSFERMMNSPRISFILPPIKNIEIIDKYKFRIITIRPFGPLISQLTHPALAILNKDQINNNFEEFIANPDGTGPYKFLSWNRGEKILLKKNENYFGKIPYFETILIKIVPEAMNRTIMLETGEADIAIAISPIDEKIIEKNMDLNLLKRVSISYTYIGLNMKKDIFKDKKLREAINYSIDREGIIDTVLNGDGQEADSPIATEVFGYSSKIKTYKYNIEKSKSLLNSIKNIPTLSLAVMSGGIEPQIAEVIQSNLKEIGINVQIEVLEPAAYWERTGLGQYDMFIGSWAAATGDADYGLYPTHHSSNFGVAGNRTFYKNEQVDKLLTQGRETIDEEKRKQIYEKIQKMIVDDSTEIMLYYKVLNAGIRKNIKGFKLYPIPIHDYSAAQK